MVSEAERAYGPVDLLVNNAGTSGAGASLWEVDADAWRHVVEVNLFGAFLYTRRALKSMVSGKKGTIVNMCSNAAPRPLPLNSEYSCSKAALIRFTECTAEAVRELGISVFAISPGLVHTTMTDGVPVFRNVPTDQWSLPERAADLIVFLASGVADSLSGRYIHGSDDVHDMVEKGRRDSARRPSHFTSPEVTAPAASRVLQAPSANPSRKWRDCHQVGSTTGLIGGGYATLRRTC